MDNPEKITEPPRRTLGEIEVILLHLENQQKLMQEMSEKIEGLTRRK